MGNTNKPSKLFLPRSGNEQNLQLPSTFGRQNYCLLSTEIEEAEDGNCRRRWIRSTTGFNIPSATVVNHPVAVQNPTNALNPGTANRNDLSQLLNAFSGYNSGSRNGLGISSDNVDEAMANDFTGDNINSDSSDKTVLQKEESSAKGENTAESDADRSDAVNATRDTKSDESESNNLIVAKLPLKFLKTIAPTAGRKRLNNSKPLRSQRRRNSLTSQRPRGHRAFLLPQSRKYRRGNYVPVRPKAAKDGNYWLHIRLGRKMKRNRVCHIPKAKEENVKYFKKLQDTELLGVIGGNTVDELLKMNNFFANMPNGGMNIRGAVTHVYTINNTETRSPFGNTVRQGVWRICSSRVRNSAAPTETFQEQGNAVRILLYSNVNANMNERSTQNNAVVRGRLENISDSPLSNYFQLLSISSISTTAMISPGANAFLNPQYTEAMPNSNVLTFNNGYLPPNSNFIPQNNSFVPQNNFLSPNNIFLFSDNALPPNNHFFPQNNDFLPPNSNFQPSNNDFLSPNSNFLLTNNGFAPPENDFPSPNHPEPNSFDVANPDTLDDEFNEEDMIREEAFPNAVLNINRGRNRRNSNNFFSTNTGDSSPELSDFDHTLPNEMNSNLTEMDIASTSTGLPHLNFCEDTPTNSADRPDFEVPQSSRVRSQTVSVQNVKGSEYWVPNCNDTGRVSGESLGKPRNRRSSDEGNFESLPDHENTEQSMYDQERARNVRFFGRAFRNDDDPNNMSLDDSSFDIFSDELEDDVFESSNHSSNSYLRHAELFETSSNPLPPRAGEIDPFDTVFEEEYRNLTGSPENNVRAPAPVGLEESTDYDEFPPNNVLDCDENIERELDEYSF